MTLSEIAELMNRLHQVTWDRCTVWNWASYSDEQMAAEGLDKGVTAFGWIDREGEERKDFALLVVDPNGDPNITTSSALYSRELDRLIRGTDEGHEDCQRIEEIFGDAVERKVVLA